MYKDRKHSKIDFSKLNTCKANDFREMFIACSNLELVKLPRDSISRLKIFKQLESDGIQCKLV